VNTRKIAKDFNLKVIYVTKNNIKRIAQKYEMEKFELLHNAILLDDTDIILGLYDDKDLKNAAFFHEIGHTKITEAFENLVNKDEMLIEYQAWIEGLKIAKKYGYNFSKKEFKYILKSINTYYKDALKVYNKHK
jgi:hypothetical protein